jgi:hypothetical protein
VSGWQPASRVVQPTLGLGAVRHTHGGRTAGRWRGKARRTGARRQSGGEVGRTAGRAMSDQAHMQGPDSQAAARSGMMHGGPMTERW